jgi:hypothetical protein
LAEWTVRLVKDGQTGILKGAGPENRRVAANSSAEIQWLPADYLLGAAVEP